MSIFINYIDCATDRKGTGSVACEVPDGFPTGAIKVPKTWSLDLTTGTFDTDYIKGKIKDKTFVPFLNSVDYEDTSEAKGTFTSSTKVKLKTVNGKPGFALHFSKGYHFHSSAFASNSFQTHDVLLVYDNGVIFGAKNGNLLKGHTMGIWDTENFMHKKGDDPQKTIIEFQLIDPEEYNINGVLLDPTANGFNMKSIHGIVDVNIEMVSNATVEVVVKVTADANAALGIEGLAFDDFLAGGLAAQTLDSLTYDTALDNGTYTLTFSADVASEFTAKTLSLKIYDSGDSTTVAEIAGVLYEGSEFYP